MINSIPPSKIDGILEIIMKKYLPLILLAIGLIIVGGVFFVIRNKNASTGNLTDEESALADVPLEKRPIVSLTPSSDGHYLTLRVEKIVIDADSFDYLLEYKPAEGVPQGVPGVADISNTDSFVTEVLLGTESSGKFRYDENVESGSIELKFRKNKKLIAKFKTGFSMRETDDGYEVTMNTIGGSSETEQSTFTSK